MGNNNSAGAYSKAKGGGQGARIASTEPQHVPVQRKISARAEKVPTMKRKPTTTKAEKVRLGVYSDQQHDGEKPPLVNDDDTFTNYIQLAKHKLKKGFSNVGRHHEEQRNPAPDHHVAVAPINDVNSSSSSNKENESRDEFFDFIQSAKKKLRTVSSMGKNHSFKRGKDSGL